MHRVGSRPPSRHTRLAATAPGPWQQDVYDAMAALSQPGATFATFTAAGAVRRGLNAAGFTVHKRRGYGTKRDALYGHIHHAMTLSNPRGLDRVIAWWMWPYRASRLVP